MVLASRNGPNGSSVLQVARQQQAGPGQRREQVAAEQAGQRPGAEPAQIQAQQPGQLDVSPAHADRVDERLQREERPGDGQPGQHPAEMTRPVRDPERGQPQ